MNLNVPNMLLGTVDNLRNIIRFSTCRRHVSESVAEHSFFVALYAVLVAKWVYETYSNELIQNGVQLPGEKDPIQLQFSKIAVGAIMHDIEESVSGDFPRAFKYSSVELKNILDAASVLAVDQVAINLFEDNRGEGHQWLRGVWERAKDESYEGRIVEFADFLASLSWLYREAHSGNQSILLQTRAMLEYSRKFEKVEFVFIRPLFQQVQAMVASLTRPPVQIPSKEPS